MKTFFPNNLKVISTNNFVYLCIFSVASGPQIINIDLKGNKQASLIRSDDVIKIFARATSTLSGPEPS